MSTASAASTTASRSPSCAHADASPTAPDDPTAATHSPRTSAKGFPPSNRGGEARYASRSAGFMTLPAPLRGRLLAIIVAAILCILPSRSFAQAVKDVAPTRGPTALARYD